MSNALLVLWVALLGADRLDLAGGRAPFVLTPFLVLSPMLIVAQALQRWQAQQSLTLPPMALRYAAVVAALLVLGGASVLWSADPSVSLQRVLLLALQVGLVLAVALHVAPQPQARALLARGAALGVLLIALMDLASLLAFLGYAPRELPLGPATLLLEPAVYAGIVPRLAGTAVDANLTGLLLVCYALLAPRVRAPALLLLLLTISRSALLAVAAAALVGLWQQGLRARVLPLRLTLVSVLALLLGVASLGRSPAARAAVAGAAAPFAERLDFGGGSASEHRLLLARGVQEATRSPARAALGMGWGSSHMVLQDVFPGHRYGNFHSLYVTVWAEAGLAALLLVLVLLGLPLARAGPWRPAVAAVAAFSVFYQATTQPVFWLVLTMAWLSADSVWPGWWRSTAPR